MLLSHLWRERPTFTTPITDLQGINKMNKIKDTIKNHKILSIFIAFSMLCYSIYFVYLYSRPDSWGPTNTRELCRALDIDPKSDPKCMVIRGDASEFNEVSDILRESFYAGITTRQEVYDKLQKYHLYSGMSGDNKSMVDRYAIRRSITSEWHASFYYDKNEILKGVAIEVGWWWDSYPIIE